MWKIALLYLWISLALFCSPLKGKEVLDKIVHQKEKTKGNVLISYKIDHIDNNDSTRSIFYIIATVQANSEIKDIKDTIRVNTTRDGILVEEPK